MQERTSELLAAVDSFNATHYRWANTKGREHIDATYSEQFNAMVDIFDAGDVPKECAELASAVADFVTQMNAFDEQENPYPTEAFWQARERLEAVRDRMIEPEAPRKLESIKELAALPNMSHEQIARMYGFVDAKGRPETHKVAQELATPGSVIGPDWVHPEEAAKRKRYEEAKARQQEAGHTKQAARAPACPETPLELFQQGVSVAQSARMLQWTEEDTAAAWKQFEADKAAAEKATKLNELQGSDAPPVDDAPADSYADMDLKQIREHAKASGVVLRGNESRAQIVAKLEAALSAKG